MKSDPEIINIKDFGAVGNQIADDTPAIQAAIDAAHALARINQSRVDVWVPKGIFAISRWPMLSDERVEVHGESPRISPASKSPPIVPTPRRSKEIL